jgi:hypothetical protein
MVMKTIVVLVCAVAAFTLPAFAQDKAGTSAEMMTPPELTAEQRQKMADIHEKMAACLRSDRPLSECRQETMQHCQALMGQEGCPMMGGMMGSGMKHRGGMKHEEQKNDEPGK